MENPCKRPSVAGVQSEVDLNAGIESSLTLALFPLVGVSNTATFTSSAAGHSFVVLFLNERLFGSLHRYSFGLDTITGNFGKAFAWYFFVMPSKIFATGFSWFIVAAGGTPTCTCLLTVTVVVAGFPPQSFFNFPSFPSKPVASTVGHHG
jgi:hypothetical protein